MSCFIQNRLTTQLDELKKFYGQSLVEVDGKNFYDSYLNLTWFTSSKVTACIIISFTADFPNFPPILKIKAPTNISKMIDQDKIFDTKKVYRWEKTNRSILDLLKAACKKLEELIKEKEDQLELENTIIQDEESIKATLMYEFAKKPLEEILFIYNNQDLYVQNTIKNSQSDIQQSLSKLNSHLYSNDLENKEQLNLKKQAEIEDLISEVNLIREEIQELELKKIEQSKRISTKGLIGNLKEYIEEKFNKTKNRMLNDFVAKQKGNYDEKEFFDFCKEYRELSKNFYGHSIIHDQLKLN